MSIFLLVQSFISLPVLAEDINNSNPELYLLGKIVDSDTNIPIANVEILSSIEKILTDANGEFLIKIKKTDDISVKMKNYKGKTIKIDEIKGKIALEKINYLPIYPNGSISINYRNIGISEKFDKTALAGRYNDSFSLEANWKFLNSIVLGLNYENLSANQERNGEKQSFSFGNSIDLKGLYLFKILPEQLELNAGLIGNFEFNNVTQEKNILEFDYVDYSNQKLGIGLEVGLGARPIKFFPLSINAFANYLPLFVLQDEKGTLPSNINSLGYGITARYDIYKNFFIKARYIGKNNFKDKYNSNISGFSIGIGYGF